MSAGLPIVTTRVAGIPSLVTHEANGLLVEHPDATSVAGAMARVIRDRSLRQGLIARGYATARTFTLEAQAARMMADVSSGLHVALRHPAIVPVA
jgi:glycosyltransferase involved in cell wall biosynthesis